MSTTINPYVGFNGRCREAMTFYQSCFGGELQLSETGDKEKIMHASLLVDGKAFIMGSDMSEGNAYVIGNHIALALGCESEASIKQLVNELSSNGKIVKPLKEEAWGGIFASVEDQFGVKWFLNYQLK